MSKLDSLIEFVSPSAALSRAKTRLALAHAKISLDGLKRYDADSGGRRTSGWITRGTSANAEIGTNIGVRRDRHRDLVRNNPWASRAVQAIVANTVGYGFTGRWSSDGIQQKWAPWADRVSCDADGAQNLSGITALVMRAVVESGECIVRRRIRREGDVPLQLQVVEPDLLDHTKTLRLPNGGWIINGVEFSPIGKRVAYWMFSGHPGDVLSTGATSVPVPASEIAHVYRVDRPGQVRGVPWGAAVMLTLRDLDDYEDAYLFRQKLANCHVGAIIDNNQATASEFMPETSEPLPESIEPGRYDVLPKGKDIKFNDPPDAGDYGPYTKDVLLRVAAGYGITYQALTGDLSNATFSSGRMGWIEMGRNIESWRWNMLVPQFLDRVSEWFIDAVELRSAGNKAVIKWTAPKREMINPLEEIQATKEAIRSGITTLQRAHRENGEDTDEIIAEIVATNATLDKHKIVLDTDPRQTAAAGMMQQVNAGGNTDG